MPAVVWGHWEGRGDVLAVLFPSPGAVWGHVFSWSGVSVTAAPRLMQLPQVMPVLSFVPGTPHS